MIDGKKSSAHSKEDPVTIRHLMEKGYTGREIRFWLISRHYRKPLTFSWAKLETARNTIAHLDQFVQKFYRCPAGAHHPDMDQVVYDLRQKFTESMDDDFNMAPALAALFEFTRHINRTMDKGGLSESDRQKISEVLKTIDAVIGVMDLEVPAPEEEIESLIQEREAARQAKDWSSADHIRDRLMEMGIEVTDTREGTIWRRVRDVISDS
ncbi:MAG: cysteine--tRNA ligase, partial [Deltaproteobacteria bacterium]|nr:cysteine--tRNA ligase [Deltaproteobacteria bacterium]